MTKRVYRADSANTATGMAVIDVADDYVLQENETFTAPSGDLKTPLTLTDGKWVGASDEVVAANEAAYLAANPDALQQPTAEQQQLAELIKSNAQQMKLNAQLIKQLAALQTHTAQEAK